MRPQFGLQGSVMGWNDPWLDPKDGAFRRTGEGMDFPSQDPTPSADRLVRLLEREGADFFLYHPPPVDGAIGAFLDSMSRSDLAFLLGNEVGCINVHTAPGTNRWDLPEPAVRAALKTCRCLGLVYDETEHLQLHPGQYAGRDDLFQWSDPNGLSLEDAEASIAAAVRRRIETLEGMGEIPAYGEHVFPVMTHVMARGGMNPCPKILKEAFTPITLAIAQGAARQYGKRLGICVDLWGFDTGPWFTRLWGFPAHSPAEFGSALACAWHQAPDLAFVENIDPLYRFDGQDFHPTEFALEWSRFVTGCRPDLPYHHRDASCRTAVIRSDDGVMSDRGTFRSRGPFGSDTLPVTPETCSFFQVMDHLAHGTGSPRSLTWFQSDRPSRWSAGQYPRTAETLARLPLPHGVEDRTPSEHPLFHPLDRVLVFDETVRSETLGHPDRIILCGSRASPALRALLEERRRRGTDVLMAGWLSDGQGTVRHEEDGMRTEGARIVVPNFDCPEARSFLDGCLGDPGEWRCEFGAYDVVHTNPSGDGVRLDIRIEPSRRIR